MALTPKTFGELFTFTRASTGTYFDANGTLQAAAINEPRFDYDPDTLTPRGVLVETSRTNSLFPSDMSTHTALGFTTSASTGVDGTQSALRMTEDLATTQRRLRDTTENALAAGIGEAVTLSVYVRPSGDRTNVALVLGTDVADSTIQEFDLDALTTGASASTVGTVGNATIEVVRDGYYRLAFTLTLTSAITTVGGWVFFSNVVGDGNAVYTGDGASWVDADRMQIEAGGHASSHIATTASAATRARDDVAFAPALEWFNSSAGTLEAVFRPNGVFVDSSVLSLNNGTQNEQIGLRVLSSGIGYRVRSGGVNQASFSVGGAPVAMTQYKAALSYRADAFVMALDGTSSTDSAGVPPSGVNTFKIGQRAGSSFYDGWVSAFNYYPYTMTAAQLEALTT